MYTEYYYEYLEHGHTHPADLLNAFPSFVVDNETFKMSDLCYDRWKYLEIGSETEELFENALKQVINKAIMKYQYKIKLLFDNISSLYDKTVNIDRVDTKNLTMTRTDNLIDSKDGDDETQYLGKTKETQDDSKYLNPITEDGGLKLQDVNKIGNERTYENRTDKNIYNSSLSHTGTRTVTDTGTDIVNTSEVVTRFRSNPEIMQYILGLKDIYLEALQYMDRAFMTIY